MGVLGTTALCIAVFIPTTAHAEDFKMRLILPGSVSEEGWNGSAAVPASWDSLPLAAEHLKDVFVACAADHTDSPVRD